MPINSTRYCLACSPGETLTVNRPDNVQKLKKGKGREVKWRKEEKKEEGKGREGREGGREGGKEGMKKGKEGVGEGGREALVGAKPTDGRTDRLLDGLIDKLGINEIGKTPSKVFRFLHTIPLTSHLDQLL